jgi:hypothetical protein
MIGAPRCANLVWTDLVRSLALPVMLALTVVQMLVFAQDGSAQAKKLEGAWHTELTVIDCQTGEPTGPTAQILYTFVPGGSVLQSSDSNVFRTPAYGIWKHTTKRNFNATLLWFRFNADGTRAGRGEATLSIQVGEDSPEFTATSLVQFFDVDGNVIQTICPTETGQRLTFD